MVGSIFPVDTSDQRCVFCLKNWFILIPRIFGLIIRPALPGVEPGFPVLNDPNSTYDDKFTRGFAIFKTRMPGSQSSRRNTSSFRILVRFHIFSKCYTITKVFGCNWIRIAMHRDPASLIEIDAISISTLITLHFLYINIVIEVQLHNPHSI